MVYVKNDGTVSQNPPIHIRVFRAIFEIFAGITFFFKSLVGLETTRTGRSRGQSSGSALGGGSSSGGGGGGGGGRPFGPGGGGGGPRFRTMGDLNKPTVSAGGCPGGSCGM